MNINIQKFDEAISHIFLARAYNNGLQRIDFDIDSIIESPKLKSYHFKAYFSNLQSEEIEIKLLDRVKDVFNYLILHKYITGEAITEKSWSICIAPEGCKKVESEKITEASYILDFSKYV